MWRVKRARHAEIVRLKYKKSGAVLITTSFCIHWKQTNKFKIFKTGRSFRWLQRRCHRKASWKLWTLQCILINIYMLYMNSMKRTLIVTQQNILLRGNMLILHSFRCRAVCNDQTLSEGIRSGMRRKVTKSGFLTVCYSSVSWSIKIHRKYSSLFKEREWRQRSKPHRSAGCGCAGPWMFVSSCERNMRTVVESTLCFAVTESP